MTGPGQGPSERSPIGPQWMSPETADALAQRFRERRNAGDARQWPSPEAIAEADSVTDERLAVRFVSDVLDLPPDSPDGVDKKNSLLGILGAVQTRAEDQSAPAAEVSAATVLALAKRLAAYHGWKVVPDTERGQ